MSRVDLELGRFTINFSEPINSPDNLHFFIEHDGILKPLEDADLTWQESMVVVNLEEHERAFLSRFWASSRIFVNQSFVLDHVDNPSDATYFDINVSVWDTTVPVIQAPLSLDLNDGTLRLSFSEFIDVDSVDISQWWLNDLNVEAEILANTTLLVNGTNLVILTISERLRNFITLRSQEAFSLTAQANSLIDFAGNPLSNTTKPMSLVLDTTPPEVTGVSINTSTGVVTVHTSEFVDYTQVRTDLFAIDQSLALGSATLETQNSSYGQDLVLHVIMAQRVEILYRMAGWTALSMTILGSSFYDVAGNGLANLAVYSLQPDSTFNDTLVFGVSISSAVKDFVAKIYFYGTGLHAGDTASWVVNGSSSCDSPIPISGEYSNASTNAVTIQELSMPVESAPLNVTFGLSESVEPGFPLCYNGVIYPQIGVVVRSVTSVSCTSSLCVMEFIPATQQQTLAIYGDGVGAGDRYKWIRSTENCDKAGQRTVQTGNLLLDSFTAGWISANISLCYKFSAESEYKHYSDISRQVYGLEYSAKRILLVEGHSKRIYFSQGFGISPTDRFKWVVSSCTEDSVESPYGFVNQSLAVNSSIFFDEINASATNTFHLCYSFRGTTEYVQYNEITLHTMGFVSYSVDEGAKDAVLINDNKEFRFYGVGFSISDRVAWTSNLSDPNGCTTANLEPFSRSLTSSNGLYTAGFKKVGIYTLCYGFGSEPFTIIPNVQVHVKDVFDVVTNYTVVALQPAELQVLGFGVSRGDIAEFAQLGYDCGYEGRSTEATLVDANKRISVTFPLGGDYVLCYTFGTEKTKSYRQIRVRAVGIASIDRLLLIKGKAQQVRFAGTGIRGGDVVRFMEEPIVHDNSCEDESKVFLEFLVNQYVTPSNFSKPLQAHPLCYKYQNAKAFKAYPQLTIRVVGVSSVSVTHVVIGVEKKFFYRGVGVSSGDIAKWIDVDGLLDPSDALCRQLPSLTDTEDVVTSLEADTVGTSLHTFISEAKKPALCYAFGGDTFRLYDFPLDVNTIRTSGEVLAIRKAPTVISIEAAKPSTGDLAKFVQANCSEETTEHGLVNGAVNISLDIDSEMLLCYYHSQEDEFTLYPNFTVRVITPAIEKISATSFVSGVSKPIRLTGTFGITANDVAKFLPQNATSCSDEGMEFSPANASLGTSDFITGTVDFVLSLTNVQLPWFLCYRFGLAEFISFRELSVFGHTLESMAILSEVVGEEATTIQMEMRGVGIAEGDSAKWVQTSCDEEGVAETSIIDEVATFTFPGSVADLAVCYKFNDEPYAMFSSAKVIEQEVQEVATISVEEEDILQAQQAEVTLTLDLSLADIEDVQVFKADLKKDLAAAIGVDSDRIILQAVRPGSVIVDFIILPPPFDSGQLNVQQALEILDEVVRVQKSGSGNASSTLLSYVKGNKFVVQVFIVSLHSVFALSFNNILLPDSAERHDQRDF